MTPFFGILSPALGNPVKSAEAPLKKSFFGVVAGSDPARDVQEVEPTHFQGPDGADDRRLSRRRD